MALTRSQIQNKINSLTKEKNSCVSEKDKYKDSLTYANKLVKKLTNSEDYLNSSKDYLKRFFTVNDKTADNGEINKTKSEINNILKKMNNTIIPSINSNIKTLDTRIINIDREITDLKRQLETAQE